MSFISEFKEFAVKGNVMDMAVGVIIGAGFGKIVTSFINDIIMPPLGMVTGGADFSDLAVTLKPADGDIPAVLFKYGAFIQTTLDFFILAFCIFLMVKAINRWQRKEEAAPTPPAEPTAEEKLLTEIRDLLATKKDSL